MALEGLTALIGSVGDAYDNAAAETVMGPFKTKRSATDLPSKPAPSRPSRTLRRPHSTG